MKPAEPLHGVEMLADPVKRDLWGLVHFFFTFARGGPATEDLEDMRRAPARLPADVASLALAFVETAPSPERLARARAIPAVTTPPPLGIDWDAVIAEGESLLAAGDHGVAEPLADACHQRASRAWAAGDRAAALPDAERAVALDGDWTPYRTTCAVILLGLGRPREALRVLDSAFEETSAARGKRSRARAEDLRLPADARFHATGGLAALALGEHADAVRRLEMAFAMEPSAPHAHALGAARYAAGDIAGAAEVELRSVTLEPDDARYRWALVTSLRKLGRDAEARLHTEEILAGEPASAAHRERFARLFGTPARR